MLNTITHEITFPILAFSQGLADVCDNLEGLTICTRYALKKGYYRNMLIVNVQGKAYRIRDGKKVCGVGRFWGYDIFLNQRIRVELEIAEGPCEISIDEIKRLVFKSFKDCHGWASRGDYHELRKTIREAPTLADIISALRE